MDVLFLLFDVPAFIDTCVDQDMVGVLRSLCKLYAKTLKGRVMVAHAERVWKLVARCTPGDAIGPPPYLRWGMTLAHPDLNLPRLHFARAVESDATVVRFAEPLGCKPYQEKVLTEAEAKRLLLDFVSTGWRAAARTFERAERIGQLMLGRGGCMTTNLCRRHGVCVQGRPTCKKAGSYGSVSLS
jgi:hypothetical protein